MLAPSRRTAMRSALALALLLPAAALAQPRTLRLDDNISGVLSSGEQASWTFDARSGQVLSGSVVSSFFDTALDLYGPSGARIASNDDFYGTDSGLDGIRLGRTGLYRIVVRAHDGTGSGSYLVWMTLEENGEHRGMPPPPSSAPEPVMPTSPPPPLPPPPPSDGGPGEDFYVDAAVGVGSIEVGQSRTIFPRGGAARWLFEGRAGEVLSLSLEAGDQRTDPFLDVVAANGDVLASDDNGGDGLNSRLGDIRLPRTGTYWFRVRDLSTGGSGSLTLSVVGD